MFAGKSKMPRIFVECPAMREMNTDPTPHNHIMLFGSGPRESRYTDKCLQSHDVISYQVTRSWQVPS